MKVVGLDLSLTSTGVAIVYDGEPETSRFTSKGKNGAPLPERWRRLHNVAGDVLMTVEGVDPDLVVIEQPAFSRTTGHMHDRSGLWWLIVAALHQDGRPVVEVVPSSRAKYATGKGNAGKDAVLAAVVRRYPNVDVTGNDEADALVLAAMGARWCGEPIETSLPRTHLAAMDAVRWPEVAPA